MYYKNNTQRGDSGTGIFSNEGKLIGLHGGGLEGALENYGFSVGTMT